MKDQIKTIFEDINDLLQQEASLTWEAKAAAEAGNVAMYEKKIAALEKVQRAIFVKRSFMDALKSAYKDV